MFKLKRYLRSSNSVSVCYVGSLVFVEGTNSPVHAHCTNAKWRMDYMLCRRLDKMSCNYLTMKYESKGGAGDKPKNQKEIEYYPNPHFLYKRNPQNDKLCHSDDWGTFG